MRNDASDRLTLIDALVEVARSECPDDWAQYCKLASIVEGQSGRSPEENGRRRLGRMEEHETVHVYRGRELADSKRFEEKFLAHFFSAVLWGRYVVVGIGPDLRPFPLSYELLETARLRFGHDEIQIDDVSLGGAYVERVSDIGRVIFAVDPQPGHGLGESTKKGLVHQVTLEHLNDDAKRPPNGRGQKAKLTRLVRAALRAKDVHYELDSIRKIIKPIVDDWKRKNPGK